MTSLLLSFRSTDLRVMRTLLIIFQLKLTLNALVLVLF